MVNRLRGALRRRSVGVALAFALASALIVQDARPLSSNDADAPPLPPLDVVARRAVVPFLSPSGDSSGFTMLSELYPGQEDLAVQLLDAGIATGFVFHTPLSAAERSLLLERNLPFLYFNIPTDIGSCYPAAQDAAAEETLRSLAAASGRGAWMLALPEFDQGGGCWSTAAGGRPKSWRTPQQAYAEWVDFYWRTLGLDDVLGKDAQTRGYGVAATCAYAFCAAYAYDLGADMVLLERGNDEVSGITPGLAMVRGAARQRGDRPWGIDLSTWRTLTQSPTQYDEGGRLTGGWSPSWFKRQLYIAFMGGADATLAESADYTTGASSDGLNPLGDVMRDFANFANVRHPDRGTPFVPMALIQDRDAGFEPKFGQYAQGDTTWYGTLPYTEGDTLLSNLLSMAYPGYETHGARVAGAPTDVAAYRRALAAGEDPRPWEPLATSTWGESFDVIDTAATLTALQNYRAVFLSQTSAVTGSFRVALEQYVAGGGTVVMTANQLASGDTSFAGVEVTGKRATSTSSRWVDTGATVTEPSYAYAVTRPTSATVIATTASGDPLITRNKVGNGFVYTISADYAQDQARTQILGAVQRLVGSLQDSYAVARVDGPPSEYLVNTTDRSVMVTIVNTTGAPWVGRVEFSATAGVVTDATTDTPLPTTMGDGKVIADVTVAPWDVAVVTLSASR